MLLLLQLNDVSFINDEMFSSFKLLSLQLRSVSSLRVVTSSFENLHPLQLSDFNFRGNAATLSLSFIEQSKLISAGQPSSFSSCNSFEKHIKVCNLAIPLTSSFVSWLLLQVNVSRLRVSVRFNSVRLLPRHERSFSFVIPDKSSAESWKLLSVASRRRFLVCERSSVFNPAIGSMRVSILFASGSLNLVIGRPNPTAT